MTAAVRLFDAVMVSELLSSSPRARRALLWDDHRVAEADQRVVASPVEIAARINSRERDLGPELDRARRRAERLVTRAAECGCAAVVFGEPDYPPRLAAIAAPPPVLWLCGDPGRLLAPAVAVVGSRAASRYGRDAAHYLGAELSARGVVVVSGMARGIDGAAHRGGLEGRAGTVAVLGCGVDVQYPREHRALAAEIVRHGVMVSEYGPSVPPRAFHFPRRNRIISGLSLAVVVVEAAARSGSLITARAAADQGREVMAVPGNIFTGRNRGGHALIRDGAKVVETVDDILEEMPGVGAASGPVAAARAVQGRDAILDAMDPGESYDLDDLVARSGLDGPGVLARLVELELGGWIERSAAGRFARLRR